jgi:hypothetical protein
MAQYIAELIHRFETSPNEIRDEVESETRDAILEIWAHRATFPKYARPYSSFDYVFAGLERLGEDQPWRFSRILGPEALPNEGAVEANLFLKAALDIEREVREVIVTTVALASGVAQEEEPWLALARQVAEAEEVSAIRQLARLRRRLRADGTDQVAAQESTGEIPIRTSENEDWEADPILDAVPESDATKDLLRARLLRLGEHLDLLVDLIDDPNPVVPD